MITKAQEPIIVERPDFAHKVTFNTTIAPKAHADVALVDTFLVLYWLCALSLFVVVTVAMRLFLHSKGGKQKNAEPKIKLPTNLWAMNLIASLGQVQMSHSWGASEWSHDITASFTAVVCFFMAVCQLTVLFIMVYDLNPDAPPVTVEVVNDWQTEVWTVNVMKWLMAFFLSSDSVAEAGQFKSTVTTLFTVDGRRLNMTRSFLVCLSSFQYLVALLVLFCGVNVVLSMQTVPDIMFSAVTVTFITGLDELFYEMLHQIFDLKSTFVIDIDYRMDTRAALFVHTQSIGGALQQLTSKPNEKDDEEARIEQQNQKELAEIRVEGLPEVFLPVWIDVLLCFAVAFPILWVFQLMSRAFYTNEMPSQRIYHALHAR